MKKLKRILFTALMVMALMCMIAQPAFARAGDLYQVLKASKHTMRMANILNRLVNGSARSFNQQTNVSLDNKYTVLDISSLALHSQHLHTSVLRETIV